MASTVLGHGDDPQFVSARPWFGHGVPPRLCLACQLLHMKRPPVPFLISKQLFVYVCPSKCLPRLGSISEFLEPCRCHCFLPRQRTCLAGASRLCSSIKTLTPSPLHGPCLGLLFLDSLSNYTSVSSSFSIHVCRISLPQFLLQDCSSRNSPPSLGMA